MPSTGETRVAPATGVKIGVEVRTISTKVCLTACSAWEVGDSSSSMVVLAGEFDAAWTQPGSSRKLAQTRTTKARRARPAHIHLRQTGCLARCASRRVDSDPAYNLDQRRQIERRARWASMACANNRAAFL